MYVCDAFHGVKRSYKKFLKKKEKKKRVKNKKQQNFNVNPEDTTKSKRNVSNRGGGIQWAIDVFLFLFFF